MKSLYAFYLGGRADRCNVELHDVVFSTAKNLEENYPQLVEKWFGDKSRLHIDAWMKLDQVPGFRIQLKDKNECSSSNLKLFFVNLGAYLKNGFSEIHECGFFVAENAMGAKKQAKEKIANSGFHFIHTDDLYDVDDIIELSELDGFKIVLQEDPSAQMPEVTNGYIKFPKEFLNS